MAIDGMVKDNTDKLDSYLSSANPNSNYGYPTGIYQPLYVQ
ncbi:MAG TPA: hypothetical protein VFV86_09550 [Nitrososphaeraceae archaeon]|nr:hypothetical protein [Nitrososphaeraceae archaeon]